MGKHTQVLSDAQLCVQSYDRKRLTALAALREAELRTGVKCQSYQRRLSNHAVLPPVSAAKKPQPATGSAAKQKQTAVGEVDAWAATPDGARTSPFPVPARLAHLFPNRLVEPGSVVSLPSTLPNGLQRQRGGYRECRSLLFAFLAAAAQAGNWVSFIGLPDLGLLALSQAGVSLARVAFIPDAGAQAANVIAGLLPAMCVVVGGQAVLTDSEKRRLSARARECGSVIFTTQPWPGAQLVFEAAPKRWCGLDSGQGWLQRGVVQVRRTGRGSAASPKLFQVELPLAQVG